MIFYYTHILVPSALPPERFHAVTDGNACRDPLPNIRKSSRSPVEEGKEGFWKLEGSRTSRKPTGL